MGGFIGGVAQQIEQRFSTPPVECAIHSIPTVCNNSDYSLLTYAVRYKKITLCSGEPICSD
jgi:hypothetical protein